MSRPIRILHVVGAMNRGGTETWLMNVLRHIDRERFQMDFLVHTEGRAAYDDEIEALGSRIRFCGPLCNKHRYARRFLEIVQEHGRYDVVHSHVHHATGFVLALAKYAGIRIRIAHSHTDTVELDAKAALTRRVYVWSSEAIIRASATHKLAASERAAECLFGTHWAKDKCASVLHCGIDFTPFEEKVDAADIRAELGLGSADLVIGHVGRFVTVKNHRFLLDVHREVLRLNAQAHLLLIGKGPLEAHIREMARQLGTAERVLFAGERNDVARLMLGAMDVFVFPSLYEGLGLAAVEAQAAGLPTIVSSNIPPEADIGCGLVERLPLTIPAEMWARPLLDARKKNGHMSRRQAFVSATNSYFSLRRSLHGLRDLYTTAAGVT